MSTLVGRCLHPFLSFTACLSLGLTACSSGVQQGAPMAQAASEPASVERRREILNNRAPRSIPAPAAAASPEPAAAGSEVPSLFIGIFKEDLTLRALVKPEAISVVSAAETMWSDGSLGCGSPGQVSTQAVVRGYRVVFSANAEDYAYHSDLRGNFVVCQRGRALPPFKGQVRVPADR